MCQKRTIGDEGRLVLDAEDGLRKTHNEGCVLDVAEARGAVAPDVADGAPLSQHRAEVCGAHRVVEVLETRVVCARPGNALQDAVHPLEQRLCLQTRNNTQLLLNAVSCKISVVIVTNLLVN